MSIYTIENFWKPRLRATQVPGATLVRGWSYESAGVAAFKEAPLTASGDYGNDSDADKNPLLLVSAPGAVGKSTLARQVAFATGAVYVDLAKADPVGGNTLSGGLVRSGLYESWKQESTAVLIDGLDEARLRVTQKAFEAFLSDIADISKSRVVPTVLFGRTGAAQDAWLILSDSGLEASVLEIGFYGRDASVEFAEARLRALQPTNQHASTQRRALELLLDRLREQTDSDGDRFAGYAPVLQAVAERVAGEGNPAGLVANIEKGEQLVTLQTIGSAILERERSKLETLPFRDRKIASRLYSADEQLERLVARVYQLSPPELLPMSPSDAQVYSSALDTWVGEHPFLNGGVGASSAVFEAMIAAYALKKSKSADAALRNELKKGAAANPFLSEFYLPEASSAAAVYLPPEHIGIVYASLRARLSLGDSASLSVEGAEDAEEEAALRAEVEVTLVRRNIDRPRTLRFDTEQTGAIRLGSHIEDVDLIVPHTRVEVGPGTEAVLVAPVNIQCDTFSLTADRIVVESASGGQTAAVFIAASNFDGASMTSVPVLRGDVSLEASWPGVRSHPWTTFASDPTPPVNPQTDEALRRLRKFVVAFRSHGKGTLARYRYKIESERMTKGSGQAVLNLLVREQILSLDGSLYFLDPNALGSRAGTNYRDCMARRFGPKTVAFVQQAIGPKK